MRRLLIAAVFLAGCHNGSGPFVPAPEPLTQLAAATRHYAEILKGASADSVAAAYALEGELDLPGMAPLKGRDAIRKFLAPLVAATAVESVEMDVDSEVLNNASAEQYGHYRQRAGPRGGAPQEFKGKFHAIWRSSPDGKTWLISKLTMTPDA